MIIKFKIFESDRKFMEGDIIQSKYFPGFIYKVIKWNKVLHEYEVVQENSDRLHFIKSKDFKKLTDDELDQYYMKINTRKYNL